MDKKNNSDGLWVTIMVICSIIGFAVCDLASRPDINVSRTKTIIKHIDLPEEFDVISTDPKHPSEMQAYRSMDTAFIQFK